MTKPFKEKTRSFKETGISLKEMGEPFKEIVELLKETHIPFKEMVKPLKEMIISFKEAGKSFKEILRPFIDLSMFYPGSAVWQKVKCLIMNNHIKTFNELLLFRI